MATQKGRNWSSGDIVTAANLSSIERGVSAMAEEYTPTIWSNGDTVTAAGLNNIEQGIVNAGGGSSDLSTAEVTVINDTVNNIQFHAPIISNEFNDAETVFTADTTESTVHEVILYKHSAFIYPDGTILMSAVTTTGNIEVTSRDGGIYVDYMVVTGDCTIAISNVTPK